MIFCPNCGARIESDDRLCPACHEMLPAPSTKLGFAELEEPEFPPLPEVTPATARSESDSPGPRTAPTPVVFPPALERARALLDAAAAEPVPDWRGIPLEPAVQVSPRAQSYPNPHSDLGRASAKGIAIALPPTAVAPEAPALPTTPGPVAPPTPFAFQAPTPSTGTGAGSAPAATPAPAPTPAPFSAPPPALIAQPQPFGPAPVIPVGEPIVAPQPASQAIGPEAITPRPAPVLAEPVPQQTAEQAPAPFVYGAEIPAQALQPAPPASALAQSSSELRKRLLWRSAVGSTLFGWGLLLTLASVGLVGSHLTLLLRHGFWNAHDTVHTTLWLSLGALIPSLLLFAAGVCCLGGRGTPRALAASGFVAQTAWGVTAVYLLSTLFSVDNVAILAMVGLGLTWLTTLVCMVLVLVAGRFLLVRAKAGKPRAVPYPLWGGLVLIVLGLCTFVHELIPLIEIVVRIAKGQRFWTAVNAELFARPMLWWTLVALLASVLGMLSGVGLLRRWRAAVALGGVAGAIALVVGILVLVLIVVQDRTLVFGGVANMPFVAWTLVARGMVAWIALGAALRFGCRLPRYLREAPAAKAEGKRLGLLDVLVSQSES